MHKLRMTSLATGLLMAAVESGGTGGATAVGLTADQRRAMLSEYDIHFLIDKSGSMSFPDAGKNGPRWARMEETLLGLAAPLCEIDSDGIDVTFFSGSSIDTEICIKFDQVRSLFTKYKPGGGTPLAEGLQQALKYAGRSPKKDLIICFTDGAPDSKDAVENVIRTQAGSQQADDDCTILFIQIGYDDGAETFLTKLDDNLNAKFDIVDYKTQRQADAYGDPVALLLDAIAG